MYAKITEEQAEQHGYQLVLASAGRNCGNVVVIVIIVDYDGLSAVVHGTSDSFDLASAVGAEYGCLRDDLSAVLAELGRSLEHRLTLGNLVGLLLISRLRRLVRLLISLLCIRGVLRLLVHILLGLLIAGILCLLVCHAWRAGLCIN